MEIFIDCEFNGFGGNLISMALVSYDGREFYEVMGCKNGVDPWVQEHVLPVLGKQSVSHEKFQENLEDYLYQFDNIAIIADWPDDIRYFMQEIITGPGVMMPIPRFHCLMDRRLSSEKSKIPHNALEDARAIRAEYVRF